MSQTSNSPEAPKFMGRTVSQVYSGRPGCACGCRGKHSYHPQFAENRKENVSARTVNMMVNKMAKFQEAGEALDMDESYVAHETATRLYIIYFAEEPVSATVVEPATHNTHGLLMAGA